MLINCSDNQCNPITRCNEDSSYINGNRDMGSGQLNATFTSDFTLRSLPSNANKKPHALYNSFFCNIIFLAWQSLYWGSWHACVDKEQGEWLTCDARACEGHQRPPRGQGHSQGTGRILSGWTFKPRQALEAVKTFDIITPRKHFMYKLYIQTKTFHIQTVHTDQNQEFVPA